MAIGVVLVLVGAALLAGQLLGIGIEDIGWPFFVIAVGAVLLLVGLIVMDDQGVVLPDSRRTGIRRRGAVSLRATCPTPTRHRALSRSTS